MQGRYSVPSPFTYSPTAPAPDERKNSSGNNLWPLPPTEAANIMKDVNRWLPITEVNGESFFEIRLKQIILSPEDQFIARLKEDDIFQMDFVAMRKILPNIPATASEKEARGMLFEANNKLVEQIRFNKTDANGAPDDKQNLNDFIDFIKENVLKHIPDDEADKKDFLAKNIAYNFHQSGFPVAVSMYYQTKYIDLISNPNPNISTDENTVKAIFNPPIKISISYDETKPDTVTFNSHVAYSNLNTGSVGERKKVLIDNITNKPISFVDVESKIHISAVHNLMNQQFDLEMKGEPLTITKKAISVMEHEEIKTATEVNTFLSKLFDDPLSGNNGLFLHKAKPNPNTIKTQQTHFYFEKDTLKYMAKDYEGNILTGVISNNQLIPPSLPPLRATHLSERMKSTAENKSQPIVIANSSDEIQIYTRKNNGSYHLINLTKLSSSDKKIFNAFSQKGPEALSRREYSRMNSIIDRYHTAPKNTSPKEILSQLKKMTSYYAEPVPLKDDFHARSSDQTFALQSLRRVANTLVYTTPKPKKSFSLSRLFFGRKKGGETSVKSQDKKPQEHKPLRLK